MTTELPLVLMSTESRLKHEAVTSAMGRAGIAVRVEGQKVPSGVNEQPMTMDETYFGAFNRHQALKALGRVADYYITVESGLDTPHEGLGTYGSDVVIIEAAGARPHVGFALDVEFPPEILAMVPAVYPDFGAWVQTVHGATEKDPFPYITNGKLRRIDTIEPAVYNVAIQLEQAGI